MSAVPGPAPLYLATVLIWGSTFYAIELQVGDVPPAVSVAWRFLAAALVLFAWCRWRRLPMRFPARAHAWMALQGALLFSVNYELIYRAASDLTSGLVAVVFSTVVLMNIANGAWLLGQGIRRASLAGGLLGVCGLALVFAPELAHGDAAVTGLALGLVATFVASLGNIVSAANQRRGLPVVQTNAYGMAYGAALMFAWAVAGGAPLAIETTASYLGALAYLAVFGSVLAFGSYLTLLGRVGADRAAYATVVFPLVALGISTWLEGYAWEPTALVGVGLVLAGNVVLVAPALDPGRLLTRLRRRNALVRTTDALGSDPA